jgi:arylsulfatase A-like enzyme
MGLTMIKKRLMLDLLSIALLAVAMFGQTAYAANAPQQKQPNILLLVGDDISFGDLGISGGVARTPVLDRLANEGVMFTRFHASPVCSVSRGMLLTGNDPVDIGLAAFDYSLYPPATGKPGYESYLTRTTATIAELLRDAGYRTYMTGKWHLGGAHGGEGPQGWGFDHSYSIYTGGANHWNSGVFHVDTHDPEVMAQVKAGKIPQEPYFEDGNRVDRPMGIYSDDLWTGKMLQYLERERESGKPFFAYLAYTTAHAPLQAPDFLIDKYTEHYLKLGYTGLKQARFEAQKRLGLIPPDAPFPDTTKNELLRSWDALSDEEKYVKARSMATYSAMMESQDYHIGMVLNYLRETGALDNTLIIYLADNGPEGLDVSGDLSNPAASNWITRTFSQEPADIGRGNAFAFIGTDMANASTGGLQWWKWFIGEGGVRVPMVIVPPKNARSALVGEKTGAYANIRDIPMTILDYAGVRHPGELYGERKLHSPTGISIRAFLDGDSKVTRTEEQWIAFELFGNGYIVSGEYKAMRVRPGMYGDGQWHLYNIQKDPGETRVLDKEQPERLASMVATYQKWAADKGIVEVRDDWSPWHGFPEDRAKMQQAVQ